MLQKEFPKTNTSWQKVAPWYKKIVGDSGHFYHREVILPNVLRLLNLKSGEKLIDLGCGQGVLARTIPNDIEYAGFDVSSEMIKTAISLDKNLKHRYTTIDATHSILNQRADKIAIILALQNMKKPFAVIRNCKEILNFGGKIVIVLNHPAFRIPKHGDWMVKDDRQFRIIDNYMTPLEIPIESSPFDKKNNELSYSYHYPLSFYSEILFDNGFVIEKIEEWVSPKKSTGIKAEIEDKARNEIPLFMAIVASKR
ncbi:MAG: class I SAM-dependent methyltransferase [Candidatus Shapirobacteria bacterium]